MSSKRSIDEQNNQAAFQNKAKDNALSSRSAGYTFLALAGMLGLTLIYVTVFVVAPLTRTPEFTEQLLQQSTAELKQGQLKNRDYSVDFLVGLEYSAASIRTVNVQIATASIGGLFLVVVGVLLFTLGILNPFGFEASIDKYNVNWIDGTPGAFCALLGTAILMAGVMKSPITVKEISFAQQRGENGSEASSAVTGGIIEAPEGIDADYLLNDGNDQGEKQAGFSL